MGTKSVVVGATLVALLVGVGIWLPRVWDTDSAEAPDASSASIEEAPVAGPQTAPQLVGAEQSAAVAPSVPAASVRGLVVDTANTPVAGASLVLARDRAADDNSSEQREPDPDGPGLLARSGDDGRFSLAERPSAGHVVLVLREGFEVTRLPAEAFAPLGEVVRVVLQPGRVLEGVAESGDGQRIHGARVQVVGRSSVEGIWAKYVTTASAQGAFRFRYVPARAGTLMAQAEGYNAASQPLEAGLVHAPVRLVLQRYSLLVHVIDKATGDSVPEAGAVLQTPDASFRIGLERLVETAGGDAHPPGWLALRGFLDDHVFPHAEGVLVVLARGYESAELRVRRDVGKPPPLLTVRLLRGSSPVMLAGVVRGASQARLELRVPRPPTWIDAGDASLPLLAEVVTGADGAFEIGGLPPGTYRLIAHASDRTPQSVEVHAPDRAIEIELLAGGKLEVQVEPPGPVWVHIEQPGGRAFWSRQADAEGRVVFDDLPPAAYRAIVLPSESTSRILAHEWSSLQAVEAIDVEVGRPAQFPLRVPSMRTVTIEIVDEHGNPRQDVRVNVTDQPGSYAERARSVRINPIIWARSPLTDEAGHVEVKLFPGVYGLHLQRGAERRQTWLRVEMDGPDVVRVVFASSTRRVEGRVVDAESGAAISGRRVEVVAAPIRGYELLGHGATDDTGHFAIDAIPARQVVLMVATNLDARRSVLAENAYGGANIDLDLTAGDPPPIALRLWKTTRWIQVAGRVEVVARITDAVDGSPVKGGSISVDTLHEGAWIGGHWARLGEDGRPTPPLHVPQATRYRISISGGLGADPPFERVMLEREPEQGRVVIEIALARAGG